MKHVAQILIAGLPTPSKKIYPEAVLRAELDRLEPIISCGAFIGELGPTSSSVVSFANASHLVTDLWLGIVGSVNGHLALKVEIEPLMTPAGQVLKKLLDANIAVNFSLVGVGSGQVNDNGELVISDNYKLIQVEAWAENSRHQDSFHQSRQRYRSIDAPWLIGE